jgi:hypothetical protein
VLPLRRILIELVVVFSSKKNEEAQAAHWWKLDLENWLRQAGNPKFPK